MGAMAGLIVAHGQCVAGECGCINPLPLRRRGHREYLRGPQYLTEALVFTEIIGTASAIVNIGDHNRPAVGKSKFIARKRRNAPGVRAAVVIKIIPRIERGIADKFKKTAMHEVGPGLGHNIGVSGSAVPDSAGMTPELLWTS